MFTGRLLQVRSHEIRVATTQDVNALFVSGHHFCCPRTQELPRRADSTCVSGLPQQDSLFSLPPVLSDTDDDD